LFGVTSQAKNFLYVTSRDIKNALVSAVRTLGCFLKPDSKKAGQTRQWRKQQVAQLVVETQKVKMEIFKGG